MYTVKLTLIGRTPWSAADALVGFLGLDERVQGDPRGPGGPPHEFSLICTFGKTKWRGAVPREVFFPQPL